MLKEVGEIPTLCRNCKVRKLTILGFLEQDMNRLEAINAVSAKNELLYGVNTSVIRLGITDYGLTDQITGNPLENSFVFSDSDQARVSRVNLLMLKEVEKKDGIGLWLSPPDKINQTGKILVAVRQGNEIVEYDTTGVTFSNMNFADFMTSLSKYFRDGYYFLDDMPWDILEGVIPMSKAWEAIRNDQAEIKFNKEVAEALLIDRPIRLAFKQKYGVDINLACPTEQTTIDHKYVSQEGVVSKFVRYCGACKIGIFKPMRKGERCPNCHGVYLGC